MSPQYTLTRSRIFRPTHEYPLLVSSHELRTHLLPKNAKLDLLTTHYAIEHGELLAHALPTRRPLCCQALPAPQHRYWQVLCFGSWSFYWRRSNCSLRSIQKPQMVHYQHRCPLTHLQTIPPLSGFPRSSSVPNLQAEPKCCLLEYVLFRVCGAQHPT